MKQTKGKSSEIHSYLPRLTNFSGPKNAIFLGKIQPPNIKPGDPDLSTIT
jgi:hypothetical protein